MTTEQRMKILLHGFRHLAFAFRDVVATVQTKTGTRTEVVIPGVVYSEFDNGPSLFRLADWVAYTHQDLDIEFVGFKSATPLGRQLTAL